MLDDIQFCHFSGSATGKNYTQLTVQ